MTEINFIEAINAALREEMRRDASVMVLGEDVGVNGGVFRATDGLLQEFGAQRVVDTPLAESGMLGCAIGLALNGMRPVAEMQFDGFFWPAFDQMISHASRYRNRTQGRFSVPLVVRFPVGGGVRALEHHCESYEAIYAHAPGVKVLYPATPYDAKGLLKAAIRDPDPVIFMEHKKLYRAFRQEVPGEDYTVPIGKANLVERGDDVTLVAWGAMLHVAKRASSLVREKGVGCDVIDLRSISPMDDALVAKSVEKTGRLVVVHEAHRSFGAAAELIARVNERAFLHLKAPPARVTGFDVPFPFYKMENWYIPDTDRVVKAIREVLKY